MNIRMPNAKEAARILREALAEKGVALKHTQVIELIARLQGYRSAHVMNFDPAFRRPIALKALASEEFELRDSSASVRITADGVAIDLRRDRGQVRVSIIASSTGPLHDGWYRRDDRSPPVAAGVAALGSALAGLKAQFADDPWCECGNCLTRTRESALNPIRDFGERVMPGEECPAGECPECGALAHICEDQSEDKDDAPVDDPAATARARWENVPAEPHLVEVSSRENPLAPRDLRIVRFVSERFANIADLDPSDDTTADQTAIEFDGADTEPDAVSFWDLLMAPLDEHGRFHLQDGRILCFKQI